MRVSQALFVLIRGAALVQSVSWTLHFSCYENDAIRGDMLLAVKDAIAQAALAAEKLRQAIALPPIPGVTPDPPEKVRRIREVASFLLPGNSLTIAQTVIARFEEVARLGDPVGKADGLYGDSQTWADLATGPNKEENYKNILIACSPSITEGTGHLFQTIYTDNLRKDQPPANSAVLRMYEDLKAGRLLNEEDYGLAVTRRSPRNPTGDRRTTPEVIYLHPLWLLDLLRKHNSLLLQQNDVDLVTGPDGAQAHREEGSTVTPMDTIMNRGVEGTVLHELFHTSALGYLHDIPPRSKEAYGWVNNVRDKNIDNADLMAILALAIKMTEKDYKIDQEGMITKY